MLESLAEKFTIQSRSGVPSLDYKLKQIEARLCKLKTSKSASKVKMERYSLIKKNSNIIYSLLTLMIENPSRENYLDLEKVLLSVNQLTL